MSKNKTRSTVAYHEAGHAVIARVQGIECHGVLMFPPLGTAGAAGTMTKRATTTLARDAERATVLAAIRKDIIVNLAGPCSEAKYHKPRQKYPDQWKHDHKSAEARAIWAALVATGVDLDSLTRNPDGHINLSAEQAAFVTDLLQQCRDAVSNLVDEHWPPSSAWRKL
jgi:hypothetical protein